MSNIDDTMREPAQATQPANNTSASSNYSNPQPNTNPYARYSAGEGNSKTRLAALAGFGVILGVGGAMAYNAVRPAPEISEDDVQVDETSGNTAKSPAHEVENFDEISHATTPTDDMSFNQAFAAARSEVGANGVFEWRNGVYHTYYAEEWSNFSDDYKAKFSSYNWRGDNDKSSSDHASATANDIDPEQPKATDAEQSETSEPQENQAQNLVYQFDENGHPYVELTDAITGEKSAYFLNENSLIFLDGRGELMGYVEDPTLIADKTGDSETIVCMNSEGEPTGVMPLNENMTNEVFMKDLLVMSQSPTIESHYTNTQLIDDSKVVILNEQQYNEHHHSSISQTQIIDDRDPIIIDDRDPINIDSNNIDQDVETRFNNIDNDENNFIHINDIDNEPDDNNFRSTLLEPDEPIVFHDPDPEFRPLDFSNPVPFPPTSAAPVPFPDESPVAPSTPHLVATDFPEAMPVSPTINLEPDPIYSSVGSAYHPISLQQEPPMIIDPSNPTPFPEPIQSPADLNNQGQETFDFPYIDDDDDHNTDDLISI